MQSRLLIIGLFLFAQTNVFYSQLSGASIIGEWSLIYVKKVSKKTGKIISTDLAADKKYNGVLHFYKSGHIGRDTSLTEPISMSWNRDDTILNIETRSGRPPGFKGYIADTRSQHRVIIKKLTSKELVLLYRTEETIELRMYYRHSYKSPPK